MKKGSKEAKAWGAKMKRLRGKPKTKRKKSTRKGQVRKTARRAYRGIGIHLPKMPRRYKKKSDNWSF
jgi:hypothetical protein|tara:strand:+ start:454 stop:654 length:201 start_codon:yes stop_codon:yes gene_type:complete